MLVACWLLSKFLKLTRRDFGVRLMRRCNIRLQFKISDSIDHIQIGRDIKVYHLQDCVNLESTIWMNNRAYTSLQIRLYA